MYAHINPRRLTSGAHTEDLAVRPLERGVGSPPFQNAIQLERGESCDLVEGSNFYV